jgi:hypothetical protein
MGSAVSAINAVYIVAGHFLLLARERSEARN